VNVKEGWKENTISGLALVSILCCGALSEKSQFRVVAEFKIKRPPEYSHARISWEEPD
jgi:hypothetical protein